MELIQFPTEIFEEILLQAITVRGLKRGLRLRLVNKMFAQAVIQALFRHRLLDKIYDERLRFRPYVLTVPYLAYRISHEPIHGNPLLRCIRRAIAAAYRIEDGGDSDPAAIESHAHDILHENSPAQFRRIVTWTEEVSEAEYHKYLLSIGICVDNLDIVRQILTKNPQLFSELDELCDGNVVFGPYDRIIAQYSGQKMVDFLLTYGTSTVNTRLRFRLFREAAICGRADLVRYAYEFKSDEEPFILTNKSLVLFDTQDTASTEVLKFIAELRELYSYPHEDEIFQKEYRLRRCIDEGQLETVKYAIQLGAHPCGHNGASTMGRPRGNYPIEQACTKGHIAIVEHLLSCGADPENTIETAALWGHTKVVQRLLELGISHTRGIVCAAKGGYIDIVRGLLDAGFDPNEVDGYDHPLASAIAYEHTAMFTLLIERGADLHANNVAETCVHRARKGGLESMLLLLQAHGVDVAAIPFEEDSSR